MAMPEFDETLPRLEQEVIAAVREPDGNVDREAFLAEYDRRLAELHQRLLDDARASYRAMEGWDRVRTQEDWENVLVQASLDIDNGSFLLDRLGAERFLDPQLMAVLLGLRRRLIEEHGATTAAEIMMIDSAVLSYYHMLRVNGWIGNLARWLEAEFFGAGSLTAVTAGNFPRRVDRVRGLRVEDIVSQLVERLMPLLDRANRMMLRNLKALQSQGQQPGPNVSIGAAGQVNVATQQVNSSVASK
jgi:hypothetical protein